MSDFIIDILIKILFMAIGVLLIGTLIPYELICTYLLKIKPYNYEES